MDSTIGDEVDQILAEREARGLQVPVVARILFTVYGAAQIGWMRAADVPMPVDAWGWLAAIIVGGIVLNLVFLRLLVRRRYVTAVGFAGAALDVVVLTSQSLLFEMYGQRLGLPAGFVFKTEISLVMVTFVAINGLALQPLYPAVATVGMVMLELLLVFRTLTEPTAMIEMNPQAVYAGSSTDPTQMLNTVVLVPVVGVVVSTMAAIARRTIRLAISRQVTNARLQQQQAEMLMRERITTLSHVVAGISHELNSPVGAIRSAVGTQRMALTRLADESGRDAQLLAVAAALSQNIDAAAARIEDVGASLRAFAHLDEGDFKRVDVGRELKAVLQLLPTEVRGDTETKAELGEGLIVTCDAKAISQVFMTILRNAFEATGGSGTVTVIARREGERVGVEISDTGRGMSEELVGRLFQVSPQTRGRRVTVGFGLPAAQSIVIRHGGTISVKSALGTGTTFVVYLPTSYS